jgi:hypothetical protein
MKYMIMMFGSAEEMMQVQSQDWIREMITFMRNLDVELRARDELIDAQGLSDATTARTVTLTDGVPIVTDGPYAESKESLIGYWVVDVASEERLLDIAGRIVAYSGKLELRPIGEAPEV